MDIRARGHAEGGVLLEWDFRAGVALVSNAAGTPLEAQGHHQL
jgi:hypothetical protein